MLIIISHCFTISQFICSMSQQTTEIKNLESSRKEISIEKLIFTNSKTIMEILRAIKEQ